MIEIGRVDFFFNDPTIYCPQETHIKRNDTGRLKVKISENTSCKN